MLPLILLVGCATAPPPKLIAAGDTVLLDYTCRLDDDALLATTSKEAAYEENARLSHAFIPLQHYGPTPVAIGADRKPTAKPTIIPLVKEIAYLLSQRLEGLAYKTPHHMVITAETIPNLTDMDRFIQFSRTMRRTKQQKIPKAQFIANTGKEPVLGDVVAVDRAIQWKVAKIQEDKVEIHYLAEDGLRVNMPYGEAVIRDRGDRYDLEIDAQVGNLVRVGSFIGRISEMDGRLFTVDFDNPFGKHNLACEVSARPLDSPLN
jgi:FKBP-type peptidyl-prolyl cis-trans isomerase 2